MQLAAQTIRRGRIVSACREPSGTLVILTAKLSLSYALRILFLYRVHLRYWRLLVEPFHFILTKVKGSFKCYVMFKKNWIPHSLVTLITLDHTIPSYIC